MRKNFTFMVGVVTFAWFMMALLTLPNAHAQDLCTIGHEHDEEQEDTLEQRGNCGAIGWMARLLEASWWTEKRYRAGATVSNQ